MGETMFGVGKGQVKASAAKRIHRIAKKHGGSFVWGHFPGDGWKYWFAIPNLGRPFDQATEKAIWQDLEQAKLADKQGLADSTKK